MRIDHPRRGEIWLVRFDPAVGTEIKKTRPAVIISNNMANRYSHAVTVLAITARKSSQLFPFETSLPDDTLGLSKRSKIKCDQVRTVDKQRLPKLLGHVDHETLLKIEDALKLHLGL